MCRLMQLMTLSHHVVAFLLLLQAVQTLGGKLRLIGPSQPVVAGVGDDVVLPCRVEPAADASDWLLEWARPDLSPGFVHVRANSQEDVEDKQPSYRGRTSVLMDKLKHGDVSLRLSGVEVSDEGTYRCLVPVVGHALVQLVVTAVSSPVIQKTGNSSAVVLLCNSGGWYPEPELTWLDGQGDVLPAGRPETVRGPDGLYTVSSRATVEKTHSNNFTCRVQQKNINQSRETYIYVPDEFFMAPSSCAAPITISLVACFTCVLAVVFSVWTWRQRKIKTTKIRQREEQQLMAEREKMKDNEKTVEELQRKEKERRDMVEELQRKEKEHRDMVDLLRKQKDELKKLGDKLIQQRKKVEEQVEANKTKLDSVEKKMKNKGKGLQAQDTYMRLREIMDNCNKPLNDTEHAHEEMLLSVQKLLKATETEIDKAMEKKEAEKNVDES